jgi:hypothetical protein
MLKKIKRSKIQKTAEIPGRLARSAQNSLYTSLQHVDTNAESVYHGLRGCADRCTALEAAQLDALLAAFVTSKKRTK